MALLVGGAVCRCGGDTAAAGAARDVAQSRCVRALGPAAVAMTALEPFADVRRHRHTLFSPRRRWHLALRRDVQLLPASSCAATGLFAAAELLPPSSRSPCCGRRPTSFCTSLSAAGWRSFARSAAEAAWVYRMSHRAVAIPNYITALIWKGMFNRQSLRHQRDPRAWVWPRAFFTGFATALSANIGDQCPARISS